MAKISLLMYNATKKKVHGLLHPEIVGDKHWDKVINVFIIVLIILNVVAVILETVGPIQAKFKSFFLLFRLGICYHIYHRVCFKSMEQQP
ncbi:MAG: hypothetical protein IPP39_17305 [Chitinophagaceae bacterium]|nr:hypothetical protein [Chitinophagaceae bacterium]